jgi:hypothetical protein
MPQLCHDQRERFLAKAAEIHVELEAEDVWALNGHGRDGRRWRWVETTASLAYIRSWIRAK